MFTKSKSKTEEELDKALQYAFAALHDQPETEEDYAKILDHIAKLHKMKTEEKSRRVSPDTWAMVGANLVGIAMIVGYEHAHVVTSKAMNLLLKPR